jgi:hypothetical protein
LGLNPTTRRNPDARAGAARPEGSRALRANGPGSLSPAQRAGWRSIHVIWRRVPKPRIKVPQAELTTEVSFQIGPVEDDVRLVDREDGIPRQVRLVRHHSMHEDRDQPRGGRDEIARAPQRLVERFGPSTAALSSRLSSALS